MVVSFGPDFSMILERRTGCKASFSNAPTFGGATLRTKVSAVYGRRQGSVLLTRLRLRPTRCSPLLSLFFVSKGSG
jgi:hypothetical protein